MVSSNRIVLTISAHRTSVWEYSTTAGTCPLGSQSQTSTSTSIKTPGWTPLPLLHHQHQHPPLPTAAARRAPPLPRTVRTQTRTRTQVMIWTQTKVKMSTSGSRRPLKPRPRQCVLSNPCRGAGPGRSRRLLSSRRATIAVPDVVPCIGSPSAFLMGIRPSLDLTALGLYLYARLRVPISYL